LPTGELCLPTERRAEDGKSTYALARKKSGKNHSSGRSEKQRDISESNESDE
jgi:hypothetical protein